MRRLIQTYKYQKFYERLPFKTFAPFSDLHIRTSAAPLTKKERDLAFRLGFFVFFHSGETYVNVNEHCHTILESDISEKDFAAFLKAVYMVEGLFQLFIHNEEVCVKSRIQGTLLNALYFTVLPLLTLCFAYFAWRKKSIYIKYSTDEDNP